jgi:hypothetical protein
MENLAMPWQTKIQNHQCKMAVHSLGNAMIETVLVLPLLLLITALVFFFGRGLVRAQHAQVMAGYGAWRTAAEAPDPSTDAQLNTVFFADHADEVASVAWGEALADAPDLLTTAAGNRTPDAQLLAQEVFERLPGPACARYKTTHRNSVPLFERFSGPLRLSHTRPGNDWRYANGMVDMQDHSWRNFGWWSRIIAYPWSPDSPHNVYGYWQPWPGHGTWWYAPSNVSILPAASRVFDTDLAQRLEPYLTQGNPLARELSNLFSLTPYRYIGPTVFFEEQ